MTQPVKSAIVKRPTKKSTSLSDFKELEAIGQGAFGKVYKAVYKPNGRTFALKRISKKQIKSQNMLSQLNNQIKISKELEHPNIIRLYETFQQVNDIYMVLQLAQNGQLYSKLMREGKFSQESTRQITRDLIATVKYLHSRNPPIIHRDIKPQNILLDRNDKIKLADFGWSNFSNQPRKTYCGTFDYLAPEMIDKSGHDEKLDIWCLGVLIYELLTGKTPFVSTESTSAAQSRKIIQNNILNVNITFPKDFSSLAKNFILGMIKRNPQQRMTLKQIQDHQWLQPLNEGKIQQLKLMHKKDKKQTFTVDTHSQFIIDNLNQKIHELKQQLNNYRINQKINTDQNGLQLNVLIRKLKINEQKYIQLQNDNKNLRQDLLNKQKQIIILKNNINKYNNYQDQIQKQRNKKQILKEKIKKLQKELEQQNRINFELKKQLENNCNKNSIQNRLKQNKNFLINNTQQFIQYLQNQIIELTNIFEESKQILNKVLNKEMKQNNNKQELLRLRSQHKNIRQQIRSELKQYFEIEKDQILILARKQVEQEKQKLYKQRQEMKLIYSQLDYTNNNNNFNNNHISSKQNDIQIDLKTIKQLNNYYQRTINDQNLKIKDLEENIKRKK